MRFPIVLEMAPHVCGISLSSCFTLVQQASSINDYNESPYDLSLLSTASDCITLYAPIVLSLRSSTTATQHLAISKECLVLSAMPILSRS